jgi:hypothetical protein
MKRLESICDSIAMVNHYYEPESEAYAIRNPGLILSDPKNRAMGIRVFTCHRGGYAALLDIVKKGCVATPSENVSVLLARLGLDSRIQQEHAIDFMARCANSALTLRTSLGWFIENENG